MPNIAQGSLRTLSATEFREAFTELWKRQDPDYIPKVRKVSLSRETDTEDRIPMSALISRLKEVGVAEEQVRSYFEEQKQDEKEQKQFIENKICLTLMRYKFRELDRKKYSDYSNKINLIKKF